MAVEKNKKETQENQNKIEEVLKNPKKIEKEKDINGEVVKIEKEAVGETLTPRQEKFCQLYTTDESCFGNGVGTYLEVYDIDDTKKGWYNTACVCASQLLSNPKVYNRINNLLEKQGLNDSFVDKQMLFLISQQADLGVKARMIGEYNKIKQRIISKVENTSESEKEKKELYSTLKTKVKKMNNTEINEVLQDLLK